MFLPVSAKLFFEHLNGSNSVLVTPKCLVVYFLKSQLRPQIINLWPWNTYSMGRNYSVARKNTFLIILVKPSRARSDVVTSMSSVRCTHAIGNGQMSVSDICFNILLLQKPGVQSRWDISPMPISLALLVRSSIPRSSSSINSGQTNTGDHWNEVVEIRQTK